MSDFTATNLIGSQWAIESADWEGEYVATGLDREQAEYGAMMLDAGAFDSMDGFPRSAIREAVLESVQRVECCEGVVFAAELSEGGECIACVS